MDVSSIEWLVARSVLSTVWLLSMAAVWGAFFALDLHRAQARLVLAVVPATAFVVAFLRHLAGRRDLIRSLTLGVALGLAPVFVYFFQRPWDWGCGGTPSDAYDLALLGTALGYAWLVPIQLARGAARSRNRP